MTVALVAGVLDRSLWWPECMGSDTFCWPLCERCSGFIDSRDLLISAQVCGHSSILTQFYVLSETTHTVIRIHREGATAASAVVIASYTFRCGQAVYLLVSPAAVPLHPHKVLCFLREGCEICCYIVLTDDSPSTGMRTYARRLSRALEIYRNQRLIFRSL